MGIKIYWVITVITLYIYRINFHRMAKSGCEYVIKHLKNVCVGTSFSFQITVVFSGIGYKNNKACANVFYTCFRPFWVVENSFLILTKLNKINSKKKAKSISTFGFITWCTTIPHNLLIEVLSEVIDFVFNSKPQSFIGFSNTSVYWTSKGHEGRYFTRKFLIDVISFLITKYYFTIWNLVFKQDIGIPMSIDPAPYWASLSFYFFEFEYVQQSISKGFPRACTFMALQGS